MQGHTVIDKNALNYEPDVQKRAKREWFSRRDIVGGISLHADKTSRPSVPWNYLSFFFCDVIGEELKPHFNHSFAVLGLGCLNI